MVSKVLSGAPGEGWGDEKLGLKIPLVQIPKKDNTINIQVNK